jgi:hypothetical protein
LQQQLNAAHTAEQQQLSKARTPSAGYDSMPLTPISPVDHGGNTMKPPPAPPHIDVQMRNKQLQPTCITSRQLPQSTSLGEHRSSSGSRLSRLLGNLRSSTGGKQQQQRRQSSTSRMTEVSSTRVQCFYQ